MHGRAALAIVFVAILAGACGSAMDTGAETFPISDALLPETQPEPDPLGALAQQFDPELLPLVEQTRQSGFSSEQTAFLFALMRAGTANLATREDLRNLRTNVDTRLRHQAVAFNAEIRARTAELEASLIRFLFGVVFGSGLLVIAAQWLIGRPR